MSSLMDSRKPGPQDTRSLIERFSAVAKAVVPPGKQFVSPTPQWSFNLRNHYRRTYFHFGHPKENEKNWQRLLRTSRHTDRKDSGAYHARFHGGPKSTPLSVARPIYYPSSSPQRRRRRVETLLGNCQVQCRLLLQEKCRGQ